MSTSKSMDKMFCSLRLCARNLHRYRQDIIARQDDHRHRHNAGEVVLRAAEVYILLKVTSAPSNRLKLSTDIGAVMNPVW